MDRAEDPGATMRLARLRVPVVGLEGGVGEGGRDAPMARVCCASGRGANCGGSDARPSDAARRPRNPWRNAPPSCLSSLEGTERG